MMKAMACVSEQTPKETQPLRGCERELKESLSSEGIHQQQKTDRHAMEQKGPSSSPDKQKNLAALTV